MATAAIDPPADPRALTDTMADLLRRGLGALSRLPIELRYAIHVDLFHILRAEAVAWESRTAASPDLLRGPVPTDLPSMCWYHELAKVSPHFYADISLALKGLDANFSKSIIWSYESESKATRHVTCTPAGTPVKLTFRTNGHGRDSPLAVELYLSNHLRGTTAPGSMLYQVHITAEVYGASGTRHKYASYQLSRKSFRWENFGWGKELEWAHVEAGLKRDVEALAFGDVKRQSDFFEASHLSDPRYGVGEGKGGDLKCDLLR